MLIFLLIIEAKNCYVLNKLPIMQTITFSTLIKRIFFFVMHSLETWKQLSDKSISLKSVPIVT